MVEKGRIVDLELFLKEMKLALDYCFFELEYYREDCLLALLYLRL